MYLSIQSLFVEQDMLGSFGFLSILGIGRKTKSSWAFAVIAGLTGTALQKLGVLTWLSDSFLSGTTACGFCTLKASFVVGFPGCAQSGWLLAPSFYRWEKQSREKLTNLNVIMQQSREMCPVLDFLISNSQLTTSWATPKYFSEIPLQFQET